MNTDLICRAILGGGLAVDRDVSLIASAQPGTPALLDLTDFKRDLSELTDRLGHAQDCL
jgi:peptide chain release factor 2